AAAVAGVVNTELLERAGATGRLPAAFGLATLDQANVDAVGPNIVRGELPGERLHQRHAGGARHRSGHGAGGRLLGANVEDVDDAPATDFAQVWKRRARGANRGAQLQVQVGLP